MAWIDVLGQAVDAISSTAIHNLGDRCVRSGKEYVYCMDSGSGISQYHAVAIDDEYDATSLTKTLADKNYLVGVAQVAVTADYYFWCLVKGAGTVLTKSAAASETLLYTTATAGTIDDESSSQTGVANIILTATAATAAASANTACFLNYPKAFAAETALDAAAADILTLSAAASTTRLAASSAMSSASIADSKALLAYSAGSSAMSSASIADSKALLAYSGASSAMSSAQVGVSNASTADSKALLAYSAGSSAMSSASIADSKALLAYSAGSSAMSSASVGASNALLAYSAGSSAMSSVSVAQSVCDRFDLAFSAYADSAVANSHSNAVSAAVAADANYAGVFISTLVSGISSAVGKNM